MQYNEEHYEIGCRVRSCREALHLTREVMAEKLDITDVFLGQIERGERSLSVKTLKKIVKYTGASADYILFGKNDNNETVNKIVTILTKNSEVTSDFIYHIVIHSNDFCKNIIDNFTSNN